MYNCIIYIKVSLILILILILKESDLKNWSTFKTNFYLFIYIVMKKSKLFPTAAQKRQAEIYNFFQKELYQKKHSDQLADLAKPARAALVQSQYKLEKLTWSEHIYILRQSHNAYREEKQELKNEIKYLKGKIGAQSPRHQELIKREKYKYFFPEKGEHKRFWAKKQEFLQEWEKTKARQAGKRVKNLNQLAEVYRGLYPKSPWRMRDRLPLAPERPSGQSENLREVLERYYDNNPFLATRAHYRAAISQWFNRTEPEGEIVPESELVLDRYGKPILQPGQWLSLNSRRPGRNWEVRKNVLSWIDRVRERVHYPAHQSYLEQEGNKLEIQTWQVKKDPALCWVEAQGSSCLRAQGTSGWWCLICVNYGPYHPPVLPKHCSWLYTYRPRLCGAKTHSEANKQWHFSIEGEKRRGKVQGGDWGSCHIGTFSKPPKKRKTN